MTGRHELLFPDANVLVALTNPSHQHHLQAREWPAGTDRFATTPITENGLVRLLLNPAVIGQPVAAKHDGALVTFDRRMTQTLAATDQKFVRTLS